MIATAFCVSLVLAGAPATVSPETTNLIQTVSGTPPVRFVEQRIVDPADIPYVGTEFDYRMPEAGQVFLAWGINGWTAIPDEIRPEGTMLFRNKLMHTPMIRKGSTFVVKVIVPTGSAVDYGFVVTRDRTGASIPWTWDGDYRFVASSDRRIQRSTRLLLVRMMNLKKASDLFLFLSVGLGVAWSIRLAMHFIPQTPRWLKKSSLLLLVNITPVVLVFLVCEIYLRLEGFNSYTRTLPGENENSPTTDLFQIDDTLGWTCNPSYRGINHQGFRDAKDFDRIDRSSNKIRVMVLGDSFFWGAGVNIEENIPSLLQRKLGETYQFYNLSIPGWGVDQMYLAYQKYKNIVDPHIVILGFINEDIERILQAHRTWEGLNKPTFRIRNGKLELQRSTTPSQRLFHRVSRKSAFISLILHRVYWITDAQPIVRSILLDIADDLHSRKAKSVVIRIPTREDAELTTSWQQFLWNNLEESLKGSQTLYLDPLSEISSIPGWTERIFLKDMGGHLSVQGNQWIADYIFRKVFGNPRQFPHVQLSMTCHYTRNAFHFVPIGAGITTLQGPCCKIQWWHRNSSLALEGCKIS